MPVVDEVDVGIRAGMLAKDPLWRRMSPVDYFDSFFKGALRIGDWVGVSSSKSSNFSFIRERLSEAKSWTVMPPLSRAIKNFLNTFLVLSFLLFVDKEAGVCIVPMINIIANLLQNRR